MAVTEGESIKVDETWRWRWRLRRGATRAVGCAAPRAPPDRALSPARAGQKQTAASGAKISPPPHHAAPPCHTAPLLCNRIRLRARALHSPSSTFPIAPDRDQHSSSPHSLAPVQVPAEHAKITRASMEEKAAETVPAPAVAVAGDLDVTYCSEHPYPPGAAAAAGMAVGSGICAFCLQEKLGMLVSSSKSSPFHPPPSSVTPTTPPSTNMPASDPPHPPAAAVPPQKAKSSSSTAATVASGLRRSKSVAPRPEEPPLPAAGVANDSPRKKSFWSFLYPSSGAHRSASSSSSSLPGADGAASARRKSVSVASSAASASMGRRLEPIDEPESPGRRSEGSSSSSFGRKVARSRSVGCGSRSFSGDFLERLSTGFGDCALRRVESHREPKPKGSAPAHLGNGDGDDDYEQHKIKCAGFFGGLGAAPPPSSSYWLSAPGNGGSGAGAGSSGKAPGARGHRSWAWALASPMRALRPTSSTSSKSIMSAHHNRATGNAGNMPTVGGSAVATS